MSRNSDNGRFTWTEEAKEYLCELLRRHGPHMQVIADKMGLTRNQVRNARNHFADMCDDAIDFWRESQVGGDLHRKELALKDENLHLKRAVLQQTREETMLERLEGIVERTIRALPPLPAPELVEADDDVVVETMVLNVGDIHGGEIVKAERVKGYGEYNSLVCQQRFAHYIDTHLRIKNRLERGGYSFPDLVVPLLGDISTGTIHDLERHTDDSFAKIVVGLAYMIAGGIRHLASHYPTVHVTGIAGNHGRLPDARKKQYKDPTRNWDYFIYRMVEAYLADQENVTCYFPDSFNVQMDIEGKRFQFFHGDDIKSHGPLPAYGLDRYARNQNAGEATRGARIDYFVCGHFHQKVELDVGGAELIVNGDMKGVDEWVLGALGKAGRPRQTFFGVHHRHGISHQWDVDLSEPSPDALIFPMTPWTTNEYQKGHPKPEMGQPFIYTVRPHGRK